MMFLLAAVVLVSGCIGNGPAPAGESQATEEQAATAVTEERAETPAATVVGRRAAAPVTATVWKKEDGVRLRDAISSSTILKNGSTWMYYTGNGIELAVSDDGIAFERRGQVVSGSDQEMVTNPAVFRTAHGYRMIYEGRREGQRKLYSAVSADGLIWNREEGVRLEDSLGRVDEEKKRKGEPGWEGDAAFTSVPDVIRLDSGCLRMYYAVIDEIRTAVSCDEGLDWQKEGAVQLPMVAQDPDIIRLDEMYKLFFSTQNAERTRGWIVGASSEDGIIFAVEGTVAESVEATHAMDADVVQLPGGGYRMYYSEGNLPYPQPNIVSAVSQD